MIPILHPPAKVAAAREVVNESTQYVEALGRLANAGTEFGLARNRLANLPELNRDDTEHLHHTLRLRKLNRDVELREAFDRAYPPDPVPEPSPGAAIMERRAMYLAEVATIKSFYNTERPKWSHDKNMLDELDDNELRDLNELIKACDGAGGKS